MVEHAPWLKHYDKEVPPSLTYPRIPIYQMLDDSADQYPHRACGTFYGRRFSYQTIRHSADCLATSIGSLGVQKGERVAVLLPNSPQYLIAYYGLLKLGAVLVPLNPLATEHELAFQITDAEAQTVITLPMFLEKVQSFAEKTPLKRIVYSRLADYLPLPLSVVQGQRERRLINAAKAKTSEIALLDFKALLKHPPLPRQSVDPDSMAILLYTGGTTGVAKGIMLSHHQCVVNAHQLVTWGHMTGEGRMLAVLPLFHGFGMSVTMNAPILAGGEIILMPRFGAKAVLKTIQRFKPHFFIGVPTMFVAFNNVPNIERYNLHSLQGIFVGAAPLTAAIKDDFEAKTGARMIEGYGLTEVVTAIMANPYKGHHKVGSIGVPFSDVYAKIISLQDGHDLKPGELGEILIKSPTLMLGYYKNEEETQKSIIDGWLHTGDIGYMDGDGYFYITDRKKDLIIVGGFNVFPREIDEILYQHPKVTEGICVGLPDPFKGERIRVYVVLKEGQTATAEEFIAYFREHLTSYKVPSEVEFRAELPKSMIGKILRRALREEAMQKDDVHKSDGER